MQLSLYGEWITGLASIGGCPAIGHWAPLAEALWSGLDSWIVDCTDLTMHSDASSIRFQQQQSSLLSDLVTGEFYFQSDMLKLP